MIQVYSQEKRMEKVPASQYYLSKDTYQGVHFEIKEEVREEFDVFVRLHGACTAPDDSYAVINLTWPIQPDGLERIRYVAFSSSGNGNFGEVHCGFTYSDETGATGYFLRRDGKKWTFIRRKDAGISGLFSLYPERQTIRPSCHTGTGYTQNFITGPRIRKSTCPGTGI